MIERLLHLPTEDHIRRSPFGRAQLLTLGLVNLVGAAAIDLCLPALPAIGHHFGAGPADVQAVIGTYLAGIAVGQMLYGPLSDRIGRRKPLLFGLLIFVVASLLCSLAHSIGQLLAARFLQALGASAGTVVTRAVIADRLSHGESASALGTLTAVIALAPVLAPVAGSILLVHGGWQQTFWFLAVGGAIAFLLLFRGVAESRSDTAARHARAEHPFRSYIGVIRDPVAVAYVTAGAASGTMIFTYISSAPGLILGSFSLPPAYFPILFGANAVALVAGSQINRHMLTRFVPEGILLRASSVTLVLALLLAGAAISDLNGPWIILPIIMALFAAHGFIGGNIVAGALKVDPRRSGAMSAIMGSASFGSGALASVVSGLLYDGAARPIAAMMLGAVSTSFIAIRIALRSRERSAENMAG